MSSRVLHENSSGKLKIVYLVVLCVLVCFTARTQRTAEQYADSIVATARKAPTTELKIEGLLNASIFWSDRDTSKAFGYLKEAKVLMDKQPNNYHSGLYHQFLGNILMEYAYEEAKASFVKADHYLGNIKTQKAYLNRSRIWNNYAVVLQKQDLEDEYLQVTMEKSLPFARLADDSASVAYQLNNIGRQLDNVQEYLKAGNYYKEAIHTMREVRNAPDNKLEIFTNAAKNAVYRKHLKEVRIFLDSAHAYARQIPHSSYMPYLYRTEGVYYRSLNQKNRSLSNFQKAIRAAEKNNDEYALQGIYHQLSLTYKAFGNYRKAKETLIKAMKYRPFENLHNTLMYQRDMADLEFLSGNYRTAYLEMNAFANGLDSIHGREVGLKVRELETRYKSVERENRIFRLEEDNRQKELALAKNRGWHLTLISGLLLALCVAFFSWKLVKKNKKLLAQNDLLHQEELRSVRQQERLGQFDAMLRGQEAERSRLARDLHDGLGGLLAGVKLKLSSMIAKAGKKGYGENSALHEVVGQLDYSVDELRRIAHDVMPESLRYGGLMPALSDLCRYMNTPMVQVTFQDLGIHDDNYPDQLRITVYRVVQELLTNAIRHANADKVILQCSELDSWLFITVEDNGKGMNPNIKNQYKGLGLMNIQNRISLIKGHIEILSKPSEGTAVNIQIPL